MLLAAFVLGWGVSASALAAQPTAGYQAQVVCGTPRPLVAACAAIRLVTGAPASAQLAARPSASAGEGTAAQAVPAVEQPTPLAGFLTPQDLHTAYALPTETTASSKQTVAVVDAFDDPTAEADLGVFDQQFGMPSCTATNGCFRKLNQEGKASPLPAENGAWAGEISIDVQMAHAICQSCHILLVEAHGEAINELAAAVNTAVGAGATEVSNSYDSPEEPAIASLFEELGADYDHPGVVITASSGDCGYLNQSCKGEPATADFPPDSPDVIAVGGTALTKEGEHFNSTVWEGSGSGCSQIFEAPAWQLSVAGFSATGCGEARSVADVAAVGSPKTGVDIFDSTPEGNGAPTGWTAFGGTSVASPIVAAEFALAGGAHRVALPAATLYSHAGESGALFDVVSGSNGSCGTATSCQAAVGFDGPSGVGSPIGLGAFSPPASLTEAPKLVSFTPSSGITGSTVTVQGSALGAVSTVELGALRAKFKVLSTTRLEVTVPDGARPGKFTVTAPAGSSTSKAKFKPTLSITGVKPTKGAPGTLVKITGVGFGSRSAVSFDGVAATVKAASASKLETVVPAGASAGPIAVTNSSAPIGTVVSAGSFTP